MDRATDLKTLLVAAAEAAIQAVDPERAVRHWFEENALPDDGTDVTVVAVGKAAPAMARATIDTLGERVVAALVVSDHPESLPEHVELIVAGHPVPTGASMHAGRRALNVVSSAEQVLFLISGGGSALLEVPSDGLDLADIAQATERLLRSGAPIDDINVVRTQLSEIKGGGLGAAAPDGHVTLAISDVIGSAPHAIASGPTVAQASTAADAVDVLERWGITDEIPPAIVSCLHVGRSAATPPVGVFHVIGDGGAAAAAARAHLAEAGYDAAVISTDLQGEAREAARMAHSLVPSPTIGVFAGETTVTVLGSGRGGRNQEAALALSSAIVDREDVALFIGTDGVDGPTDAAGAIVDGGSHTAMLGAGIDPTAALADNDSHRALDAIGALIRTGPTGTNVGDLWLISRS